MQNELLNRLEKSQEAFLAWKETDLPIRQSILTNVAKLLNDRKEKYAHLMTKEMHKPISQSIAEIEKCAMMCEYYANAQNILEDKIVDLEKSKGLVRYEPMGVILGIMPWNYPFWQVLRFAIPTILAGNAVVLKHASICRESGDEIQKLFSDAGLPIGVFTHFLIGHSEVEDLIKHPIVKAVSLTGSEVAGRKIAELAGANLKKCVLELGGNDAFIVLKDADISKAAKDGAQARLQNSGQTCVAAKRFIIEEPVFDSFIKAFTEAFKDFVPSDPFDPTTKLSMMAREDLADELENQYQRAIEEGAEVLVPLKRLDSQSFLPGLLLMNTGNKVSEEELFGPLGMVFKAKDSDDALAIANEIHYGLANAVYTSSKELQNYFSKRLESGSVAVNQIFRSDWRMPFGGRKNSGYGIEMSLYTLEEFTIKKGVVGLL